MTTTPTSGAADLLDLIEAYAEARHRQGHSSYNGQTAAARQAVKDTLAAAFGGCPACGSKQCVSGECSRPTPDMMGIINSLADRAAQADSVQEDAARYRWLRATTNYVTSKGERIDVRNHPDLWDAVIDAARKQGGAT